MSNVLLLLGAGGGSEKRQGPGRSLRLPWYPDIYADGVDALYRPSE